MVSSKVTHLGNRIWQMSHSMQLVEGGSAAYFVSTSLLPATHDVVPKEVLIYNPHIESVIDSLLMCLAVNVGDDDMQSYLLDTQNVFPDGSNRNVAAYWDISDEEVRPVIVQKLSKQVRLGITKLEKESLIDENVIEVLGLYGFDVDLFELTSSADPFVQASLDKS
jgi:hypothetical protein